MSFMSWSSDSVQHAPDLGDSIAECHWVPCLHKVMAITLAEITGF